jgi:hypothetical protein
MMTMTNEEIKEIVKTAIHDGISGAMENRDLSCRYRIEPGQHDAEHEALRKFIKVMSRIEDMKWSVLQKFVVAIVGAAFALMVYGALAKLTIFGGFGWPGR